MVVKKSKGLHTSLGSGNKSGSGDKPLIASAMRLLQLFCEGHNNYM